jgi:hypothetical protein
MCRIRPGQHTTHSGPLNVAAISRCKAEELMHSKTRMKGSTMIEMSRLMTRALCAAVAAAALGVGVATAGPAAAAPTSTTPDVSSDQPPPVGDRGGLPAVVRAVDGSVVPGSLRGGLPALWRAVDGSVTPVPVRGGLEGLIDQLQRR